MGVSLRGFGPLKRLTFTRRCREYLRKIGRNDFGVSGVPSFILPLIDIVQTETDEKILAEAATLLGEIKPPSTHTVLALVGLIMRDPISLSADEVRYGLVLERGMASLTAEAVLKSLSPAGALEILGEMRHHPDKKIRFRILRALVSICVPRQDALPLFLEFLKDHEPKLRQKAVLALGRYPRLTEQAVADLMTASADSDPFVRLRADYVLTRHIPGYQRPYPDAAEKLVEFLKSDDRVARADAFYSCNLLGSDASHFIAVVFDEIKRNKSLSLNAAGEMGAALREVVRGDNSFRKPIQQELSKLAGEENALAAWTLRFFNFALKF